MTERLIDAYPAAGFDLDGVIYRGPDVVPGAPETLAELRRLGVTVGFVTNNAARSPSDVADHLQRVGVPCRPDDIVTSAQAEARLMARELDPGSEVLVVGSRHLTEEVARVGLRPVAQRSAASAAVVVGYEPSLRLEEVNQGCYAIQQGARWFACNNDATRPTDEGLAPGMGGILALMRPALPGLEPTIGGKPFRPLLDETMARLGTSHLLFVGDRLDTDIEGARRAGLDSLFVFTGSHGKADLVQAGPERRPTWLAHDVQGLLQPPRRAVVAGPVARCGRATARLVGDRVDLAEVPPDAHGQMDALGAILALVWRQSDAGLTVDAEAVVRRLDLVP